MRPIGPDSPLRAPPRSEGRLAEPAQSAQSPTSAPLPRVVSRPPASSGHWLLCKGIDPARLLSKTCLADKDDDIFVGLDTLAQHAEDMTTGQLSMALQRAVKWRFVKSGTWIPWRYYADERAHVVEHLGRQLVSREDATVSMLCDAYSHLLGLPDTKATEFAPVARAWVQSISFETMASALATRCKELLHQASIFAPRSRLEALEVMHQAFASQQGAKGALETFERFVNVFVGNGWALDFSGTETHPLEDLSRVALYRRAFKELVNDTRVADRRGTVREALHQAISSGDADIVTLLCRAGLPVDHRFTSEKNEKNEKHGWTALSLAAQMGQSALLTLLVKTHGAQADLKVAGATALHLALRAKHDDAALTLLRAGADIDALEDDSKLSAFELAAQSSPNVFEEFVRAWAAKIVRPQELSCVEDALAQAHRSAELYDALVQALLALYKRQGSSPQAASALLMATTNDSDAVLKLLLLCGADANRSASCNASATQSELWTSLTLAARDGREKIVDIMLGHPRTDVDATSHLTALQWAAKKGHLSLVNKLLAHGAKVDLALAEEDYTPLHYAAWAGEVECIKALLDGGANINALSRAGATPLVVAALRGHASVVSLLLSKEAELIDATVFSNDAVVQALGAEPRIYGMLVAASLRASHLSADPDLIDKVADELSADKGSKPAAAALSLLLRQRPNAPVVVAGLLDAVAFNHPKTVELLLQLGAAPTVDASCELLRQPSAPQLTPRRTWTPLTLAARLGHHEIVEALLATGCNPNKAVDGWSPLGLAAAAGHVRIVEKLLEAKAVVPHGQLDEKHPAAAAATNGNVPLLKILLPHCPPQALMVKDDMAPTLLSIALQRTPKSKLPGVLNELVRHTLNGTQDTAEATSLITLQLLPMAANDDGKNLLPAQESQREQPLRLPQTLTTRALRVDEPLLS